METRAHHLAVGTFVLVLLAALAGFVVWIGKFQAQASYAYYDILFGDDVTGLSVDGPVRYRGVTVGRVADIRIDPENPTLVRVTIQVVPDTPVMVDSVASLEAQGITGILYVLLKGGTQGAARLPVTDQEPYPTIASVPGKFAALLASAPELLQRATQLVDRVSELFDDKNRQAIADTLENLRTISGAFAENREGLGQLIRSGTAAADEIRAMSADMRTLAQNVDRQINSFTGATQRTLDDLRRLSQSFGAAADQIDAMVAENRRPLNDFTSTGLYELTQMATEMRALVAALTRISTQFERDPARFLFGDRQRGFEPK